jgi:hypothetical protein
MEETPVEVATESEEAPLEVATESEEAPAEVITESEEAPVEVATESEENPFEAVENNTDTVIPPKSELKEIQDLNINNEIQEPKEEGFGETLNNMVETTKEYFSPKTENEEKKGGKRKNRKSRKGLRTKRFRGGNNRKTKKGRRNSRRLRK